MSRIILKDQPCPRCGSSDALQVYEVGNYCFSCHTAGGYGDQRQHIEETEPVTTTVQEVQALPVAALKLRGISKEIAERYDVRVEYDGMLAEQVYYFPMYGRGEIKAYQAKKARLPGNRQRGDTWRIGSKEGIEPFGSQQAKGKGRMCVVVEGAEDCLAGAQLFALAGKRYSIVATLGTDGWKRWLPYFEDYENVVIAYDPDSAGREATDAFAMALKPGQARLARLPRDPNAMLTEEPDGPQLWMDAVFNAEQYRPEGVLTGEVVWDRMQNYSMPETAPYPDEWALLKEKMIGMRAGEISIWTAGSSIGKTAFIRTLKVNILDNTDWRIGEVELEEKNEKTWRGFMSIYAGARWQDLNQAERRATYEATYGTKRIITLDHRSQFNKAKGLVSKFKYLHYNYGVRVIFLDHVTLAVNEFGDGSGTTAQDQMMNEFLEFVESTSCHLCLISHLRKPPGGGKSWSEGAIPSEEDMKGSGSLYQVSADVVAISRDKQHPDPYVRNTSQLHATKCRETGDTGPADLLFWDQEQQSLTKAVPPPGASE
ncbi:MAG: toprim domain-containing protein [Sulfuritalea sp.]|jgi:twinkle protein|nr:toprim domain-containing protein [Sulfuritalea sp.]